MKNKILIVLCLILCAGLLSRCEKIEPELSEDSNSYLKKGKPADKGNKNPSPGTIKGEDYGDLYILDRYLEYSGLPDVINIAGVDYFVPVDEYNNPVERWTDDINDENYTDDEELWGEFVDASLVQEVDFGRLNIVRSPPGVLDQALDEALKVLDPQDAVYPNTIYLDFCGRLVSHYYNYDVGDFIDKTIDSPRENMAIYRSIMQGFPDTDPGSRDSRLKAVLMYWNKDPLTIAASCFAAGSDKTGTVDVDEVVYVNGFMNCYGDLDYAYDLDFNDGVKYFYNFESPVGFSYDRKSVYETRGLRIVTLLPGGTWEEETLSVYEAMTHRSLFNGVWDENGEYEAVEMFAMAVDDAVQVLEFVHGDSNIDFLPDWEP